MSLITIYLLVMPFAMVLNTGLDYAYIWGKFPTVRDHLEDLGNSILFGFFTGLLWPVGTPMVFLLTGFAKYGWRLWS